MLAGIIAAHPKRGLTEQDAERLYQAHKQQHPNATYEGVAAALEMGMQLPEMPATAGETDEDNLRLDRLTITPGRSEAQLSGPAIRPLAEQWHGWFTEHRAENYLQVEARSPLTGRVLLTAQCTGKPTPDQLTARAEAEAHRLRAVLREHGVQLPTASALTPETFTSAEDPPPVIVATMLHLDENLAQLSAGGVAEIEIVSPALREEKIPSLTISLRRLPEGEPAPQAQRLAAERKVEAYRAALTERLTLPVQKDIQPHFGTFVEAAWREARGDASPNTALLAGLTDAFVMRDMPAQRDALSQLFYATPYNDLEGVAAGATPIAPATSPFGRVDRAAWTTIARQAVTAYALCEEVAADPRLQNPPERGRLSFARRAAAAILESPTAPLSKSAEKTPAPSARLLLTQSWARVLRVLAAAQ
jgi:hypothetical protein